MEKYEILYHDRRTEIVDHDTVDNIITELEMFERTDVSQIHLLKDNGDFDTVWTEEEGLFVDGFGLPTRDDDYDEDEDDYEDLNEDEGSNDNKESDWKDTNFVVVVDYQKDSYLGDSFLLGWSNNYDWFDDNTQGYEILTDNQVQKNKYGIFIEVNDDVSVYVGETLEDCKGYCDSGNQEGYDCTVCKLEKDNDDYKLIPVYPTTNN